MVWRFSPSDVKALDLRDAQPGDFLCVLRPGKAPERWLKLGGDPKACNMLNLNGSNAMVMWEVQAQQDLPTLRIAQGPKLQLEIPESESLARDGDHIGDLLVADSGAYFVATVRNQGFSDTCCISLATWEAVGFHAVTNIRAAFKTWRLVEERETGEMHIPLSFGTWS